MPTRTCARCVLPETFPDIELGPDGLCNYCRDSSATDRRVGRGTADDLFATEQALSELLGRFRRTGSKYDVLVPVSGGVDSCSALVTLVEQHKLRALAFHNDHGYEDPTATENVRRICAALDVDLVIWQHDLGFMKRLWRYVISSRIPGLTGCLLCGMMLYRNAVELAKKHGIPLVINGYSKGQAALVGKTSFQTDIMAAVLRELVAEDDRELLSEFRSRTRILDHCTMVTGRESVEEALARDKIVVLPWYLCPWIKTDKESPRPELMARFGWKPMRSSYPRRTTNCDMVWLNCHADLAKFGYTFYHDEYSRLVRAGELSREQALSDLELDPPEGMLTRLAAELGVDLSELPRDLHDDGKGAR